MKRRKPLRCGCRKIQIGNVVRANGRKTPLYRFDRCQQHRAELALRMLELGFRPSKKGWTFLREQAS